MEKGYVHVYTGNGKGKTTASMGLALRAVCAGKKVIMIQFIKGMEYSELSATDFLPNFKIEQYGRDCFIAREPEQADFECALIGLQRLRDVVSSGEYDIVIADEINIALFYELIPLSEVIDLISNKPDNIELVLTGRYAKQEIIDIADLVTEMLEIKHYYYKGVAVRKGIEN